MIKKSDQLTKNETAARELGISYGTYIAYRDSGYLEKFIEQKNAEKPLTGEIVYSNVIGSSRSRGIKVTRQDSKLC